jgi:cell division protein FtsZ
MTYDLKPRILVFGVGGAGGNAVDNMIDAGLRGVEFVVANTDAQAMSRSKAPHQIQLGPKTTAGLGAGARPDIGTRAAEESIEEIRAIIAGAHMVFIAAGMGGGTGTGAAPIIARAASEQGILTVAVVTKPFGFEGTRRMTHAEEGLAAIRAHVDTMIVVPNQNLFRIANDRTTFAEAFRLADDVLYSGVRGITDLMVMPGLINLDFADVNVIMRGMGTAMMGMGEASGERRAYHAARQAIDNPLLDEVTMKGAKGVLINITGGYDMTLFELDEAANEVRREVDPDANIILGSAFDDSLNGRIRVSVVAAGVDTKFAAAPAPKIIREPVVTIAEPLALETDQSAEDEGAFGAAETGPALADADIGDAASDDATDAFDDDEDDNDDDYFDDEMITGEDAARDLPDAAETPGAAAAVDAERPIVITPHRPEVRPETRPEARAAEPSPVVTPPIETAVETAAEPAPVAANTTGTPRAPAQARPAEKPPGPLSGFSSLFGWRRGGHGANDDAPHGVALPIVSSPDDHPEAAPFDDADLEIPAFLRRSANH